MYTVSVKYPRAEQIWASSANFNIRYFIVNNQNQVAISTKRSKSA